MTIRRSHAALALAAVLAAPVGAASAPPVGPAPVAAADAAALNPLSASLRLDDLAGFRDRPLFVPTRRPPPPPEAVVVDEPPPEPADDEEPEVAYQPEAPSVRLSGVLEIDSEAVAMLRSDADGVTRAVRVGDPVDDWTVAGIDEASVTFSYEDRTYEIRIFEPGQLDADVSGLPGPDLGSPLDPMGEAPGAGAEMLEPGADPDGDGIYDDGSAEGDPVYSDEAIVDESYPDDAMMDEGYYEEDPGVIDASGG